MPWLVYLQDTNGTRRLVGRAVGLTRDAAEGMIRGVVAAHSKQHKVDYFCAEYAEGALEAACDELMINLSARGLLAASPAAQ